MISHNHYDHCDLPTLSKLFTKSASRPPILFVGLNGEPALRSTVGKATSVVEMDWWEDRIVEVEGKGKVKVTCSGFRPLGLDRFDDLNCGISTVPA
jgi:N-acyl-phosphatidylethanolamine-hydrolysing phospholipase D